jgi:uncharacterized iron-regulated membrane protein
MPLRNLVFWLHLAAGLLAGIVIAIMSFTGAVIAFEKDLVAWSERDARRVVPPPAASRVSVDELLRRARETKPDLRPTAIALSADPAAAVVLSVGRTATYYANPYTAEITQPASTKVHDFLHVMEEWHRWLARSGDSRPVGKLVNGIGNLVFFVLAVTGLYIWWPRNWSWRALKPSVWFVGARGKARDWNWHNAIGFWCSPILIVLTLTALPISFRWAGNGIYRLVGETPPAPAAPGAAAGPAVDVPQPADGAKPLSREELVASAQRAVPNWELITLRLGSGGAGGARGGAASSPESSASAPTASRRAATNPQAVNITIREKEGWPLFASTQLWLDPFTGTVLRKEGFSEYSTGRQIRSWTRFLHTGEALGVVGQVLAMLASIGGVFLVYTGFALSWRRFFGRKKSPLAPKAEPASLSAAAEHR